MVKPAHHHLWHLADWVLCSQTMQRPVCCAPWKRLLPSWGGVGSESATHQFRGGWEPFNERFLIFLSSKKNRKENIRCFKKLKKRDTWKDLGADYIYTCQFFFISILGVLIILCSRKGCGVIFCLYFSRRYLTWIWPDFHQKSIWMT